MSWRATAYLLDTIRRGRGVDFYLLVLASSSSSGTNNSTSAHSACLPAILQILPACLCTHAASVTILFKIYFFLQSWGCFHFLWRHPNAVDAPGRHVVCS